MATVPGKQIAGNLREIIADNQQNLCNDWIREMSESVRRGDLMKESELRAQCVQFLTAFSEALGSAGANTKSDAWEPVRDFLGQISTSRARLRLARNPKWRIRTKPRGNTCKRKRRRNSSALTVIFRFLLP